MYCYDIWEFYYTAGFEKRVRVVIFRARTEKGEQDFILTDSELAVIYSLHPFMVYRTLPHEPGGVLP